MYIDFMMFSAIAMATGIIILSRILSSDMKYQKNGLKQLVILALCHNAIDLFWGLTYYDKIGMGTMGLYISTYMYFCSNSVLSFAWFMFLYHLMRGKPKKWVVIVSSVPMVIIILMEIVNPWTGVLFTIGDTAQTYLRGTWYSLERTITTGYMAVIFIWSIIKFVSSHEKKKYMLITVFALVPLLLDTLQIFFVNIPSTSVEFQLTLLIVYIFMSAERSDNVFISASDRQKNIMKTALAHSSMSWYEFNVDKDCIYESKVYISADCSWEEADQSAERYSVYYDFFIERVFPEYKESYRDKFSIENLKKSFKKGETELSLRYWICDESGEELYIVQTILLMQDNVSKDIIGFSYERDITSEEIHKREIEEKLEEIKELNSKLEILGEEQKAQINATQVINEELTNRISIIQSMSKAYFASYCIDVANDTFEEIRSVQSLRNMIGIDGKAQESLYTICDNVVKKETADALREFVNLSTIDERMHDTDVITTEYIGKSSGWSRMYMIVGDRNNDGSVKTLFVAARMIHEEKQREEQQNKIIEEARITAENANNAKTEFLFNMSHDIRTPMNAIIGFTELLEKYQDIPEKRVDYIKKIKDSNKVLLSIINNVLEMASIEKGAMELNESPWSVEQFSDTMYSVFADMMHQKNIEFSNKVDVQHHYVFCDSIKIREIFINILSNAYKYTEPGGKVYMTIEELPSDKEGYALFKTTITDTGIGMSEDFIPCIFDEFVRENTVSGTKIEGTGLGMPIVKRLIDFLGGDIEVQSEKGVGSSFIITLSHKIAGKSDLIENTSVEIKPDLFRGKRILLVEDNELNAEIAMEILKEEGFEIEWAQDGQIAVDMLKSANEGYYNLIIMDIQMPNINGYEATKEIRKLPDPHKANIPILAMTANAFEEDKKNALNAGMNGHLGKPIDVYELLKMLAELLE